MIKKRLYSAQNVGKWCKIYDGKYDEDISGKNPLFKHVNATERSYVMTPSWDLLRWTMGQYYVIAAYGNGTLYNYGFSNYVTSFKEKFYGKKC